MKLFVVGSNSPNPDDWSIWSEVCLVVANNEEEALKLADNGSAIAEIPLDKAQVLIKQLEPSWGDDL